MKTKIHKINRKRFAEMFADDTQDELGDRCYEPGGFLDVYGDTLVVPAGWPVEKAYEEMYRRFWVAYVAHLGCDTLEGIEGFVEFYYNLENAVVSLVREYANQTIYEVEFDDDRTVPAGRDRKRLHVAGQGVFEEIVFEPLVKEKTKTYILTLSRTFPKGHPREGQETEFAYSFMKALYAEEHKGDDLHADYPRPYKIHTIRANYDLWKRRIDEVNAGRAVLSVREWLGAPRRSKQRELFRLDRDSGIGVEKLWRYHKYFNSVSDLDGRDPDHLVEIETARMIVRVDDYIVANNDGLTLDDWEAWFRDCDRTQPMAIIHFTNFRYCGLKEGSLPL